MFHGNWVFVLMISISAFSTTALTAAPVPKDVEKEKQERFRKLRESYDKKLKSLGDSEDGERLQVLLGTAKRMAQKTIRLDSLPDSANRDRLLENHVRISERAFRDDPELLEAYQLYCYELRKEAKKP